MAYPVLLIVELDMANRSIDPPSAIGKKPPAPKGVGEVLVGVEQQPCNVGLRAYGDGCVTWKSVGTVIQGRQGVIQMGLRAKRQEIAPEPCGHHDRTRSGTAVGLERVVCSGCGHVGVRYLYDVLEYRYPMTAVPSEATNLPL